MDLLYSGSGLSPQLKDSLSRAVVISLFSWRRADPNDDLDDDNKYGWWADQFSPAVNDRIGSKLWQLQRKKITDETILTAKEYCEQALQWLIEDGICKSVEVTVERNEDDYNRIDAQINLYLPQDYLTYKFKDLLNDDSN